jgi:hypothetical protein
MSDAFCNRAYSRTMTKSSRAVRVAGLGFLITAASACSSCFVRGTRVRVPSGVRAIEDLRVGDEVLSYSLADRKHVVRRVANVLRSRAKTIHAIRAGEFEIAGVTPEHPFWDASTESWREVSALSLSSVLLVGLDAHELRPQPVTELKCVPARDEVDVFNVTIEGEEQNYFANGILVHNKSRPCDEPCGVVTDVVDVHADDGSDVPIDTTIDTTSADGADVPEDAATE